jgi:hypothetical protein
VLELSALAEALEDVGQHLRVDALAGVAHDDLDVRVRPVEPQPHEAALGRELHGIHQQVPDDLLEPGRVASHRPRGVVEFGLEPDLLGLGRGPDRVERALQHLVELDRADVEAHLAGADARQVEQVVDQLHLHVGVAHDRVHRPLHDRRVRELAALQHARPAEDGIERRAQLVRQDGQELLLGAVGGLGALAGDALLAQQLLALGLALSQLLARRRESGGHVADLLDRAGGWPRPLAASHRQSGDPQAGDRPVDAARDGVRRQRPERERQQDAPAQDRERSVERALRRSGGDSQHRDPAAAREPAVGGVDALAFQRLGDSEALRAAGVDDGLDARRQAPAEVLVVGARARDAQPVGVHDRDHPLGRDALAREQAADLLGLDERGDDVQQLPAAHDRRPNRKEPSGLRVAHQVAHGGPARAHHLGEAVGLHHRRQRIVRARASVDERLTAGIGEADRLPARLQLEHPPRALAKAARSPWSSVSVVESASSTAPELRSWASIAVATERASSMPTRRASALC